MKRRCASLVAFTLLSMPLPAQTVRIREFPVRSHPFGIARATDGRIWFTEYFVHALATIAPDGTVTEHSGPFSFPGGIAAAADGSLWFTQINLEISPGVLADAIGRYDPATRATTSFRIPTYPAQPHSIVLGPDGNFWFTEYAADRIGMITPSGTISEFPVWHWSDPDDICVGPDGALWFTNFIGDRLGRITTGGALTAFAIPDTAGGVTAGPDGNIWFTEYYRSRIGRMTTAGAVTEFPLPTPGLQPARIATGPDGNIWFAESRGSSIGRMTPGGVLTEFPVSAGWSFQLCSAGGAIWFNEFGSVIGRVDFTADAPNQIPIAPPAMLAVFGIALAGVALAVLRLRAL